MNKQPEALRLAGRAVYWRGIYPWGKETAAELCRLHTSEKEGWRYADKLEQDRKRLQEVNAEVLEVTQNVEALGMLPPSLLQRVRLSIAKATGETE